MPANYYTVPTTDKTIGSVKSTVLAAGVSLLFMYMIHYGFQIFATLLGNWQDKERNRIKQKLLETSRILYLFIIATMFSIYPPFYYGPHCAILSWVTLIIVFLLHLFCFVEKQCKERTLWAYFYFIYHIAITVWIILILIIGYTWSNQQSASLDE